MATEEAKDKLQRLWPNVKRYIKESSQIQEEH